MIKSNKQTCGTGLVIRAGFTLVELLVVIGIIAMLVGMLLPVLSKARAQAAEVVCQSNMRQIAMGLQMYADRNRGFMPQKGPDGSTNSGQIFGPGSAPNYGVSGVGDDSLWFNAVPKALGRKSYYEQLLDDQAKTNPLPASGSGGGSNSIFLCPMANAPGSIAGEAMTPDRQYFLLYGVDALGKLATPNNQFKFNFSYVINSKFSDVTDQNGNSQTLDLGGNPVSAPPYNDPPMRLSRLRPASLVVVFVEKMANAGEYKDKGVQLYDRRYPAVYNGKITKVGLNTNVAQPKSNWKRFTTRHRGGGYLAFADGHVGWFSWPETQIQLDQMPYTAQKSDANQRNKIIWSVAGKIN